jgi:hypothetical protein
VQGITAHDHKENDGEKYRKGTARPKWQEVGYIGVEAKEEAVERLEGIGRKEITELSGINAALWLNICLSFVFFGT